MKPFLFIVGRPRSGTKLLHQLLQQQDVISLLPYETEFLHHVITRHKPDADCNASFLEDFEYRLTRSPYWSNLNDSERNAHISAIYGNRDCGTCAIFLQSWLQACCLFFKPGAEIFGIKSPSYLKYTTALQAYFPDSALIHLVRDPRAQVASTVKAWNKHPLLAAQRWQDEVGAVIGAANLYTQYFEQLIQETGPSLEGLSQYLAVEFDPQHFQLERSVDPYSPMARIETNTLSKYKEGLSETTICAIERICQAGMLHHGYLQQAKHTKRSLHPIEYRSYQLYNAFQLYRFHWADKGMISGLRYFIRTQR